MERYAWKAVLIEGKLEEYIKRHDELWPEMTKMLNDAGIHNYTIWNVDEHLFGYYECDKGIEYAAKIQSESPICQKWEEHMKDVMIMHMDPVTGVQNPLKQVFFHK